MNYKIGFNLCVLNMCYKTGHYISKSIGKYSSQFIYQDSLKTPTEDDTRVLVNLQVFALGGTKTQVCLRLYLGMRLSGRRCPRL